MNRKRTLILLFRGIVLVCIFIVILYSFFYFSQTIYEISQVKLYPENASPREVVSSENFSLIWSKETEDSNRNIVYTQLFFIDEENFIYVTKHYLNSVGFATGTLRWSITIPEYSTFHLYEDRLYSLTTYDNKISFAPEFDIKMPKECHSSDLSTMHVYNPHNGERIWEYSYQMIAPHKGISFENNSAFINGLTINFSSKYISELEVDLTAGEVLGASCRNLNDYEYSNEGRTEGVMSSGFGPVYDDLSWKLLKANQLAVILEGTRLMVTDKENKQLIGFIEFSGSELNPFDVQMVYQNNILIIYLEDSNQIFAFGAD